MAPDVRQQSWFAGRQVADQVFPIDAGAVAQAGGSGGGQRIEPDDCRDADATRELAHETGARAKVEQDDAGRIDLSSASAPASPSTAT